MGPAVPSLDELAAARTIGKPCRTLEDLAECLGQRRRPDIPGNKARLELGQDLRCAADRGADNWHSAGQRLECRQSESLQVHGRHRDGVGSSVVVGKLLIGHETQEPGVRFQPKGPHLRLELFSPRPLSRDQQQHVRSLHGDPAQGLQEQIDAGPPYETPDGHDDRTTGGQTQSASSVLLTSAHGERVQVNPTGNDVHTTRGDAVPGDEQRLERRAQGHDGRGPPIEHAFERVHRPEPGATPPLHPVLPGPGAMEAVDSGDPC